MARSLEVILAVLGLLVASPVILALVVAIRLDSPGPGIFRQVRVGREGRPFCCLKLRTMRLDAPSVPTHLSDKAQITRLGAVLRRSKLDELPQLWNVLWGEMSFVGPRPCLPSQTELVALRRSRGVLALRPGITGLAQIEGIDMSDPARLAARDAAYLAQRSLATDLAIIAATLRGPRGPRHRQPG